MLGRVAGLALALLVACDPGNGTLVVQVRSDLTPGDELFAVETRYAGGFVRVDHDAARDWGAGVRVAELTLPRGPYSFDVVAVGPDGEVLASRPVRADVGALTVVTVLLTRDCAGVVCPDGGDPAATACLAGRCVDAGCSADTPEACGPATCNAPSDCATPSTCAAAECVSGACFASPDHAACGDAMICDVARGCLPAAIRDRPFGMPARIDELSTENEEEDPTLTADGLEIFFTRVGVSQDIWTARRGALGDPFDPPVPVEGLATVSQEYNPAISSSGTTLYVAIEGFLFVLTRADRASPWSAPERVLAEWPESAACPAPARDDLELVYCTYGPAGTYDLHLTRRPDLATPFTAGSPLERLNGPGVEGSAYLRVPGSHVLYFSSERPTRDLFFAERGSRDAELGDPIPLAELNGPSRDEDPWLSDDERTIVFASDRGGDMDLYVAER